MEMEGDSVNEALCKRMNLIKLRKDEYLIKNGDSEGHVYIILDGYVMVMVD